MKRFTFVLALISIIAVSCTKGPVGNNPGYTEYIIPANEHYSTGTSTRFQSVNTQSMHFAALFDSSCMYSSKLAENFYDINKLYGFSDCNTLHHENSARVGWLWNGTAIELHAYTYVDSVRASKLLGTVALNTPADLTISVQGNQYVFTYNGTTITMPRGCNATKASGYQLYPYFGGDETAPHEMHIYIKNL